jgi:xanthine dehydrogenase accessory factor
VREVVFDALRRCLAEGQRVALATVVDGPGLGGQLLIWAAGQTLGGLGAPRLNQRAALHAEALISARESGRKSFDHQGQPVDVFFEVVAPPMKLVMVGAVHVAVHLFHFARELGFETILVDPRTALLEQERFAEIDRRIDSWPEQALGQVGVDETTFVAVLSHDPKIDLPALETALRTRARYIGVLGSKRSHQKRLAALEALGFEEYELRRLHAPIGLDLGGRRAEEIALAIAAEMVAVHYGRELP